MSPTISATWCNVTLLTTLTANLICSTAATCDWYPLIKRMLVCWVSGNFRAKIKPWWEVASTPTLVKFYCRWRLFLLRHRVNNLHLTVLKSNLFFSCSEKWVLRFASALFSWRNINFEDLCAALLTANEQGYVWYFLFNKWCKLAGSEEKWWVV